MIPQSFPLTVDTKEEDGFWESWLVVGWQIGVDRLWPMVIPMGITPHFVATPLRVPINTSVIWKVT